MRRLVTIVLFSSSFAACASDSGESIIVLKNVQPGAETCNGVDDDCNGKVDDGKLCKSNEVCFHGKCVPPCGQGEFVCPQGLLCSQSLCIDPKCVSVTCPDGEVCTGGVCKAACDGIKCPVAQVCSDGACIDYCAGKTCPMGQVCEAGACVASCTCNPCGAGKACDQASGHCIEPSCVGMSCGGGTLCQGGACVDPCAGAVCPAGQACAKGMCMDVPGGGTGGNGGAGGLVLGGAGGKGGKGGGAGKPSGTGGVGGIGGVGGASKAGAGGVILPMSTTADDTVSPSSGACGCQASTGASMGGMAALLLLGLSVVRRRARRDES